MDLSQIDWPFFLAIYFICWWLCFLIALPIGVVSQEEDGSVEPGSASSAPSNPRLGKKALWATGGAILMTGFFYWLMTQELIAYDDIPFLPKFQSL